MNTRIIVSIAAILTATNACGDSITNIYMPGSGGSGGGTDTATNYGGNGGDGGSAGSTDSASSSTSASNVGAGGDVNTASSSASSSSADASSSSIDAASSSSSGEPEVCFTDCGGSADWTKRGAYCGVLPKCGGGMLDCGGCGSPMWCNSNDHLCKCLPDSNSDHTCSGTRKPSRCGGYDALKVPDDCGYGGDYWCCGPL